MPAKRRTASNRRKIKKNTSGGVPAWFWLLGGVVIGLGIALLLMMRGYLPELKQHLPSMDSASQAPTEPALIEESDTEPDKPKKPRYDFFTVLPEMEVVVPEQELSREAGPSAEVIPSGNMDSYVLQAGSFKNAADAEQMKARLALLGSMATVQTVTVNDQTWHRVRIGPVEGARKADEMRRMLSDNQIETLVMKVNP
jgi:cell division protein FtsN